MKSNPSILITHSYLTPLDRKQWKTGRIYPPLGTLQAAAVLRAEGYSVHFHDMMFTSDASQIRLALQEFQPRYFVIYDDHFNYLTKMCLTNMRHAAYKMAKLAQETGAKVIVSSSDSTDHYTEYLDHGADYILLGEGEETLKELINHLEKFSGEPENIQGLAYRSAENLVHHSRRPVMTDLDALPFPAWDLLNITPYKRTWKKHKFFSINVYTTRGCPFKCNWCAKPLYGNRYHARSPQNVVKELRWMKSLFEFDHIWFCDDILGLKPGWLEEFAEEVSAAGLQFRFTMQGRADLLCKEETVSALSRAGCETVWMGAESGSQKILDAMDKGQTIEQIYQSVRLLRKWNIKPAFFLQFGYPGETTEDIRKTFSMLKELMPDDIGVSISYPLPGTKFYENVKEQLSQKANWTDSDELALMFRNNFSPVFYKKLHRYVHYYYRSLQSQQTINNLLNHRERLSGASFRKAILFPYYQFRSILGRRPVKMISSGLSNGNHRLNSSHQLKP